MPRIVSGGGINSRQVVQSKGPKVEPVSHKGNVAGVAQQGLATAFRKEPLEQGAGYQSEKLGSTGIAGATFNPATSGPGSGRTIFKSGSQSPTPPAPEMPAGREILGSYGPEISGPGRRR